MAEGGPDRAPALHDFWRARRRANLREALSFLSREPSELLSYEDVRRRLRAVESTNTRLEEVPLDKIVGSLGRYNDFTRGFLPRQNSDKDRWAGVRQAMTGLEGVPPVELYRIGDAYFVKDGNHRVSVARQLGAKFIQAYVTPVHARVGLSPSDDAEDVIIKAEYSDFLLDTRLDELRPEADLTLTVPGQYGKLLQHISEHRYFMGIDRQREISYSDAVTHWYDAVYLPVVESIRRNGLLRDFPGRTETDLYLWLAEHRGQLEAEMGWSLATETVIEGLATELTGGDRLSEERREEALRGARGEAPFTERICQDILVSLPDPVLGAAAAEQAIVVARREGARLYGLHVDESLGREDDGVVDRLRAGFQERCSAAGLAAQFAVTTGRPFEHLLDRSPWSDLVVVPIANGTGRAVLPTGHRAFLRNCPRPILIAKERPSELRRPMLAFDGGQRSQTALFIAAYIALHWRVELTVVTVSEAAQLGADPLESARNYLEAHGVKADYRLERGRVGQALLGSAQECGCDLVLVGSYKFSRWLESMLGGVLEELVRRFPGPVLVA